MRVEKMGFGVVESKVRVIVGLLLRSTMSRECERLGKGFRRCRE